MIVETPKVTGAKRKIINAYFQSPRNNGGKNAKKKTVQLKPAFVTF